MIVTQRDIAHLSDADVRAVVVAIMATVDGNETPSRPSGGLPDFWRRFAVALVRASRERRRAFAVVELDYINGDDDGAIVEPDVDPVADALDELRRAARGEGLE
jgi:hypothetical protein